MLADIAWPLGKLHEALATLAAHSGLKPHVQTAFVTLPSLAEKEQIDEWVMQIAISLGFETSPANIRYPELSQFLQHAGPSLIRLPTVETPHFLALLAYRQKQLIFIGSDLETHAFPIELVRSALCHPLESAVLPEIEQLLQVADIAASRYEKARIAILQERLSKTFVGGCWLLEVSPGADFWQQLRLARVIKRLRLFLVAHAVQYGLFLLSWWLIGQAVFQNQVDTIWLLAWGFSLLTLIPLRLLATWQQGVIAIAAGGLLQKRLLFGAMQLHPDEIRHMGAGQLMGRVFESESVETLAINGGLLSLMAMLELLFSGWVLAVGAGGVVHLLLLVAWVVLLGGVSFIYYQHYERWTDVRRHLTHDLIERMVGHRTRMAQIRPTQWHDGEDAMVANYAQISTKMDKIQVGFTVLAVQGWLLVGMGGLLPSFVSSQVSPAALAVSIGGVLSAYLAFQRLSQGIAHLVGTAVAWRQISPLFAAASRPQPTTMPILSPAQNESQDTPIVQMHNLTFRYPQSEQPVLQGCDLQIKEGDHILIEGESGGGKSTLTAILAGLRQPGSGLLLVNGYDQFSLDSVSRQQVIAAAPQFHENHVLGSTFLFNLAMARNWPPQKGEYAQAKLLCDELGLGELLDKMPSGIGQMVGEIGWQLSHGERSRLFIARALFQGANLVILDESFSALDPQTLQTVMKCARKRATALIVIAHP